MVIMSMEAYDDLLEIAAADAAIFEAENEFKQDRVLHDARETISSLRKKHF